MAKVCQITGVGVTRGHHIHRSGKAKKEGGIGKHITKRVKRVIFPNLRVAVLSGAFLTLAIVVGEFTIASFLARPAFGPYISELGERKPFEPASVSLISFGLTWLAMIALTLLGRGRGSRVQVAGAR